ncbi:excisionase family DNA-binding protein [Amycolatopsis sp. NPDC059027]|uniref:excisionase family DNA-binding protein n=1 Tax=Amycolatopsis sp. NPDC059027 TaxID=3346709 RepID=UPI0036709E27
MTTANDLSKLAATVAQIAEALATRETTMEPAPRALPPRLLLTVEEAADYLGIGRTLMFALIKDGEIETVQIHRLRRVPREAVDDYASRLRSTQHAA